MLRNRLFVNLALLSLSLFVSVTVAAGLFTAVSEWRLKNSTEFHDPNTRFDPELGWAPIPKRSIVTWQGVRVSSNAAGFRSPEVDSSRGHVLLVGDSVVWGYKVNDDETVSRYLQDLLDGRRSNLQALNLGVSGYGIDQYYLWLRRKLDAIPSPRAIVVVITTVNDWANTGTDDAYGKSKPLFALGPDGELRNTHQRVSRYSLVNLASMWNLPGWARPYVERWGGKHDTPEDERKAVVRALFRRIAELAAERRSRLLFVLSPSIFDLRREETAELRLFKGLLAEGGFDVLDFRELLKRAERHPKKLFLDWTHYTPQGNRRLAEAIFERLEGGAL